MENWLIVGYYTTGTPYVELASALRKNLDSFQIPHDIREVPNLGTWQKNTQFKSEFVRRMMAEYPDRPLVQLDMDAEIKSYPHLFDELTKNGVDIAAYRLGYDENKGKPGMDLLNGTLYVGPTEAARAVVKQWIANCQKYPRVFPPGLIGYFALPENLAWDQRMLDLALIQLPQTRFRALPAAYTFIFDMSKQWHPDVTAVIEHHAAGRQLIPVIDGGSIPT